MEMGWEQDRVLRRFWFQGPESCKCAAALMQLCLSLSRPKEEGCTRKKSPSGQIQRKAESRFICQTDR